MTTPSRITGADLDKLVQLADRRAAAQIDAGACGTRSDWEAKRKAERELETFLDALKERLP
jgi:hypothetical protein